MRKLIVVDTNVLFLLVVGMANEKFIPKFSRLTNTFQKDDFSVLKAAVDASDGVVVTPNTLSETSNFLRQISDPIRTAVLQAFRQVIGASQEKYVPSVGVSARNEFLRFGLSDVALLEVIKSNIVLLSTDARLCHEARLSGYEAINFLNLREDYHREDF